MSDIIIRNLEKGKKQMEQGKYLGLSIAVLSVVYGIFIVYFDGNFMMMLHKYIQLDIENMVGICLIVVGALKAIAIIANHKWMKRITIIMLLFLWGGLFVTTWIYAIGDGYPSPMPFFFAKVVCDCYRIVIKGEQE